MIHKKFPSILLFLIVLLAFFLRFYQLTSVPPGLNWDEVAIGYNAHSILLTGKDEFGNKFPVYFRSFDDYKLPVYVYLTAFSEKVFGYGPFAVRFSSAFFGILSIYGIYLLTNIFFRSRKLSLLTSLLLAFLPWHVQFSRMALESAVASTFVIYGLVFLFWSFRKVSLILASVFLFILSLYTYHSSRVIVPMIILYLGFIYWRKLIREKFYLFLVILLIAVFGFFIAKDMLGISGSARMVGTSGLNDDRTKVTIEREIKYDGALGINWPRKFFHENQIVNVAGIITKGYLVHFSPEFLFLDSGRDHHTPGVGLVFVIFLPFIFLGIFDSFSKNPKGSGILVFWLLVAPIPSSITWDIPNAIRIYSMVFPIVIFAAIGILRIKKILPVVMFIGIYFWSVIYFSHQYYVHLPVERSRDWLFGRQEMVNYVSKEANNYKKVIFSLKIDRPLMFMLFYSKYDPKLYLAKGGTFSGGWKSEVEWFDKFEFRNFDFYNEKNEDTLFVGVPDDFPVNVGPIKVIKYLDGQPAIYFVKT